MFVSWAVSHQDSNNSGSSLSKGPLHGDKDTLGRARHPMTSGNRKRFYRTNQQFRMLAGCRTSKPLSTLPVPLTISSIGPFNNRSYFYPMMAKWKDAWVRSRPVHYVWHHVEEDDLKPPERCGLNHERVPVFGPASITIVRLSERNAKV